MASASERKLALLFVHETEMIFGRCRSHLRLVSAIDQLARRATIRQVTRDLGYGNASSYTIMFERMLGQSLGRYVRAALRYDVDARATTAYEHS